MDGLLYCFLLPFNTTTPYLTLSVALFVRDVFCLCVSPSHPPNLASVSLLSFPLTWSLRLVPLQLFFFPSLLSVVFYVDFVVVTSSSGASEISEFNPSPKDKKYWFTLFRWKTVNSKGLYFGLYEVSRYGFPSLD